MTKPGQPAKDQKIPALQMPEKLFSFLNRDWVLGLLLLAITLAAYQPALNGQLLWDDDAHLTRPELRSLHGLARIWTEPGATQQYYPLVHTVFWIAHRVWGDSTPGYHLLNILLHLLSALLLVRIFRSLGVPGKAAWLAGAIFALHPVQVESVAWITELKNTLSGVFFLGTGLAYLKFDRERSRKWYVAALGLFVLGFFSKSVIATLPVSLLAVFWWKRGKLVWRQDIFPLLPFFVLGIASGLFTAWMERHVYGAEGNAFSFTIIERCLIAGRAIWFYLGKIVWPVNLIFIYPRWNVSQAIGWQYLFPVAVLVLAGVLWTLRNRSRAPLAVFLCFTATIFPVLGFFNVYPFRYSFVADHFQYLALIGPIALASAGMQWGLGYSKQRFLKPALFGMLLLTLGVVTWNQCGMYANLETLYRTTIRKDGNSWMAHNNLGILLANTGRTDEAMVHCRKALELDSNSSESHNNLGLLLAKTGRTDEAMAQYRKALSIRHNDAEAYNNLGNALFHSNRKDEAMACFRKALEINPDHVEAHNNLGNIALQAGRTDEAMAHYRKALELNPDYVEAHNNLGIALQRIGRTDEAMAHYRKALELNPDYVEAHYNLGILLAENGRMDEAVAHYWKALELNPDNLSAINNCASLFLQKGRQADAVRFLQGVLDMAKFAGDESQAKTIAGNLEKLKRAGNPPPVPAQH